jgi:hypothetical protein
LLAILTLPCAPAFAAPIVSLLGDADCDGLVAPADIEHISAELADGDGDLTADIDGGAVVSCMGADANSDGRLTVADILALTQVLYGEPTSIGPAITFLGIASADGTTTSPVTTVPAPMFQTVTGLGFRLVVEAMPGISGLPVGQDVFRFDPFDASVRPDLQIETSRDLGDGNTTVCGEGGVASVMPPHYGPEQEIADALNDFSCRFDVAGNPAVGCTKNEFGSPRFVDERSRAQFCLAVSAVEAFQPALTIITARLLDTEGNPGPIAQMILRVGEEPLATATPLPTATLAPSATVTDTVTPGPSPTASDTPTPASTSTVTATGAGPSPTRTGTRTRTGTPTRAPIASATATNTRPPTFTVTGTVPATNTRTATGTRTRTGTRTATPTITPSRSPRPSATATGTVTRTRTRTGTPTVTITGSRPPTATNTATRPATATRTRTRTGTAAATRTPTATPRPGTPTRTGTATRTASASRTPTRTGTPTRTPTITLTRTITRTPTQTGTPTATARAGADITYVGLARADDRVIDPVGMTIQGWPIYERELGYLFSVVVEAKPGPSRRPVGLSAFNFNASDPNVRPDFEIIVSRPLGDGSAAVCDNMLPMIGGVPASPNFNATQAISNAINDFACRFVNGAGLPRGRSSGEACTLFGDGEYRFVVGSSTAQFCAGIAEPFGFAIGDTIVTVRVRDVAGNPSAETSFVVRVRP